MFVGSFLNLWFICLLGVYCLASQGSSKPLEGNEYSLGLHKRTDLNSLYNSVPSLNKVPVGGAQAFILDLTKSTSYSTAYFYGCTVVITVDGNGIIIGHFAQQMAVPGTNGQQSCTAMKNAAVVEENIIKRLENVEEHLRRGYRLIKENLVTYEIPAENIRPHEYTATSAFSDFHEGPKGKAVVEVISRSDGSGATINVYIESDTPTWSQNYNCNGNPVTTTKHKRVAAECPAPGSSAQSTTPGPTNPAPAGPTPTCSQQQEDPDQGIWSGYCVCTLSGTTKTGSLLAIPTTAMATAACAYPTLPGSAITPSASLGPATTMSASCEVCTPVVNNEDSCTTIANCFPEAAQATVQVGSSPVHVGTLTSSALYTAVSSALDILCPTVSQTQSMTSCTTDTVTIGDIPYSDGGDGGPLATDGELLIKVAASAYNVTSLRNAMINSAALTAMKSAMGSTNCYTAHYTVEELCKRSPSVWSPIRRFFGVEERDRPYPETESATWCNAASFAGVQYYGQFWRMQPTPASTDYIDASWEFQVGPGGDFLCGFLEDLVDALGVVEPEFAVEDVQLGKEIQAACMEAMNHA